MEIRVSEQHSEAVSVLSAISVAGLTSSLRRFNCNIIAAWIISDFLISFPWSSFAMYARFSIVPGAGWW